MLALNTELFTNAELWSAITALKVTFAWASFDSEAASRTLIGFSSVTVTVLFSLKFTLVPGSNSAEDNSSILPEISIGCAVVTKPNVFSPIVIKWLASTSPVSLI